MTIATLIEKLQEDISWLGYNATEREIIEHIKCAITLLKEQEAKLVLNIADSIAGMEIGDCPGCGRYLVNKISDPSKFCKYCGQAVKWNV